jgi:hypothetical protein
MYYRPFYATGKSLLMKNVCWDLNRADIFSELNGFGNGLTLILNKEPLDVVSFDCRIS